MLTMLASSDAVVGGTQLRTAAAGAEWAKLIARTHAALRAGGLGQAEEPYRRLVVALDGVDDSFKHRDGAGFRTRLREMVPALKTTERVAERRGLRCTVHSADGSASITFGAGGSR